MEVENGSLNANAIPQPPRPPDGGGPRGSSFKEMLLGAEAVPQSGGGDDGTAAEQGSKGSSGTANPTPPAGTKNHADLDLHGDWMVVNRGKKSQKSRDKAWSKAKKEQGADKGQPDNHESNKFEVLNSGGEVEVGNVASSTQLEKEEVVASGPSKIWTRKKRHRTEPKLVHPVVRSDEGFRPFLDSFAKSLYQKISPTAQQSPSFWLPKPLPFGFRTTMPVEVVSHNRLRLVDEDKPPDPSHDGAPLNPNCEDGVMHVENDSGSDMEDVVAETPLDN
ncbi:hypothetical protein SESBI_09584 [Sesbania bispinosa]|nr:hypothetical protein SESBI_09584 [Sesbania bispinosa]